MAFTLSNEPRRVRRVAVWVLWGTAVLAALPALWVTADVVSFVVRRHRLPPVHEEDAIVLIVMMAPPVLPALAAEGLRRATRWAVGLGMTVAIGAGTILLFVALLLTTQLSSYDDVRRRQFAAVIGLASLAVGLFTLAFDMARCREHVDELRGRVGRAFEPVMGAGHVAGDAKDATSAGRPEGESGVR